VCSGLNRPRSYSVPVGLGCELRCCPKFFSSCGNRSVEGPPVWWAYRRVVNNRTVPACPQKLTCLLLRVGSATQIICACVPKKGVCFSNAVASPEPTVACVRRCPRVKGDLPRRRIRNLVVGLVDRFSEFLTPTVKCGGSPPWILWESGVAGPWRKRAPPPGMEICTGVCTVRLMGCAPENVWIHVVIKKGAPPCCAEFCAATFSRKCVLRMMSCFRAPRL